MSLKHKGWLTLAVCYGKKYVVKDKYCDALIEYMNLVVVPVKLDHCKII
jgi:hypothetical protein